MRCGGVTQGRMGRAGMGVGMEVLWRKGEWN